MCTVIVRVPSTPGEPTRLVAVRDEDPNRPWHPVGPWWPDTFPGVVGVHDVRAGGAWLAADPRRGRLAVLLNRHDDGALPDDAVVSRGTLPLASVAGESPDAAPRTRGFNLLEIGADGSRVVSWDGSERRVTRLEPGTHMIAHDDLDDPRTARITRWLPEVASAATVNGTEAPGHWWDEWIAVIDRSAALDATDDRAIIRDHRHLGIPTLSLLVCVASVGADGVEVRDAALLAPGVWGPPRL
jgi:hypothetical protein